MPAPMVWRPTLALLDAALAGLSPTSQRALQGARVREALNGAGLAHDADNALLTPGNAAALAAAEAQLVVDLAAWNTSMSAAFDEADRAARFSEDRYLMSRLGAVEEPAVFGGEGGLFVLAPAAPLVWADDASETPVAASLTLSGPPVGGVSPIPLLTITAQELGAPGDRIEVSLTTASSGHVDEFDLKVRLGAYLEHYTNLSVAREERELVGTRRRVSDSLLIRQLTPLGIGRPSATSPTWRPLAGGVGATMETLRRRIERVMRFSSARATERATAHAMLNEVERLLAGKPALRGSNRVIRAYLEARATHDPQLLEALYSALDYLTFLAWTPA